MSARATAWAFTRRGLDPGAHLLLLWLADQACDEGVVGLFKAVSRRTMADTFGCSMDTVDRRVKALCAAGLMAVERRQGVTADGAVTLLPSVYRLTLDPPPATPSRVDAATPSRVDAATPSRVDAATPSRVDAATPGRVDAATLAAGMRLPWPQRCGYPGRRDAAIARVVIPREYSERESLFEPSSEPSELDPTLSRAISISCCVGAGATPADPHAPILSPAPSLPPASSAAIATPGAAALQGPAAAVLAAVASPWLDPSKSLGLVTTAPEVARWLAAGADLEGLVIPVVAHAMARPRSEPVTTWKYFQPAIRRALREAQAAQEPLPPLLDPGADDEHAQAVGRGGGRGGGGVVVLAGGRAPALHDLHARPARNDPPAQRAARQRGLLAALSEVCPDLAATGERDVSNPGGVALPHRPAAGGSDF